jgi:hypothetical protein
LIYRRRIPGHRGASVTIDPDNLLSVANCDVDSSIGGYSEPNREEKIAAEGRNRVRAVHTAHRSWIAARVSALGNVKIAARIEGDCHGRDNLG